MKKLLFVLLLLAAWPCGATSKVDSLEQVLKKEPTHTGKLVVYIKLFEITQGEDRAKSFVYLQKASELCKTHKSDTSVAFRREWSNLYESYATYYNSIGDNKKAIAMVMEAKKITEEIKDLPLLAAAYTSLGYLYNFTSRNEDAVAAHSKALEIHNKTNNQKGVAESYNNLGLVYYELGQTDKTKEYFLKSLEMRKKLGNKKDIGQSLNNVAFLFRNMGDMKTCIKYLQEALKIREDIDDQEGIGNSCSNLGLIYKQLENYKEALKYMNRAVVIFEKTGNMNGQATVLHNMSIIYEKNKKNELAKKYALQAMELAKKIGDEGQVARCLNSLSGIARNEQKNEEALQLQLQALELRRKIKETHGIANSLQNLGVISSNLGDDKKAIVYLEEALAMFRQLNEIDNLSACLDKLAGLHKKQGNNALALKYFQESFDLAKKLGFPDLINRTARPLSDLYGKKGDFPNAYKYLLQYTLANDSSSKVENLRIVNEMEEKYKADQNKKEIELKNIKLAKKDAEIKQKDLADEKKTNLLIFSFGGIALVLVLVFVLLSSNRRRKKANQTISLQKQELEEKNKEVLDSINYAKFLQEAILPPLKFVNEAFEHRNFIYYQPKDIVAGDFYWIENMATAQGQVLFFAAADCTGHGVPGAMVSVVCCNALNRATKEFNLTDPGKILDKTRELVLETFARSEGEVRDGMDISLCAWNKTTNEFKWAGANNPLWIVRNSECTVLKADKQPIGRSENPQPFTTHVFNPQAGDMLYLFTDGFSDQFGGEKGKKMKQSNFQKLVTEIDGLSPAEQNQRLAKEFGHWKGHFEQTDDVCVIGVRI